MLLIYVSSIILLILTIPIHFLSVEHKNLENKYGKEKGSRIGMLLGRISGYGHFFVCFFIWFLPQPHFQKVGFIKIYIPVFNISVPIVHLVISFLFIVAFSLIENSAVKAVTMKTAVTHSVEKLVDNGPYAYIRHPQHFGQLMLYAGMTVLFSGLYSLIFFPFYIVIIVILSRKEERELINEFGEEYKKYMKRVPMLIPNIKNILNRNRI